MIPLSIYRCLLIAHLQSIRITEFTSASRETGLLTVVLPEEVFRIGPGIDSGISLVLLEAAFGHRQPSLLVPEIPSGSKDEIAQYDPKVERFWKAHAERYIGDLFEMHTGVPGHYKATKGRPIAGRALCPSWMHKTESITSKTFYTEGFTVSFGPAHLSEG
jgi:hypothetical protein